jgi:hypothetical protein
MQEYVSHSGCFAVPHKQLEKYFALSRAYARTLKPKATKHLYAGCHGDGGR